MFTLAENAITDRQGISGSSKSSALLDDEDGRELAEHGEPAQPQDRVQPDMRARFAEIGGGGVGHRPAILPFRPSVNIRLSITERPRFAFAVVVAYRRASTSRFKP